MRIIQHFWKKGIATGLMALVLVTGSFGVVHAQLGMNSNENRNAPPVWEEVDRPIKLNPANPAPPDVVSQLVSLNVAYHDFQGRQRQGIVEVNKALEGDVVTFFKYAYYLNFPIKEVAVSSDPRFGWDDNKLMAADVTSCFNYRTIAGTNRPSQHGLGRACDFNPVENPYITLDDQGNPNVEPVGAYWNPGVRGTLFRDHPLIQLMLSRGWVWGGNWTLQDTDGAVIDYQHLQKAAPATTDTVNKATSTESSL